MTGQEDLPCELAAILAHFTHVCAPAQCEALEGIVDADDTTASQRILAESLLRMTHVAAPDDRQRLMRVMRDPTQPRSVRVLASLIREMRHTLDGAQRARMQQLPCALPALESRPPPA